MSTLVWMTFVWLMFRTWCKRSPRVVHHTSLVMRGSLDHREWILIPAKNLRIDEQNQPEFPNV